MQQDNKIAIARVAVLPFMRLRSEDASVKAIRCPLCGSILRTEQFPQDAEKTVEDIFFSRLRDRKKVQIISPETTAAVFDRISAEDPKRPLPDMLKKVGTELQSGGIVVGYVSRYRERKGYSYAAEQPASVTFEVHLVRTSDGAVVWKGLFDKTQQSLTENMFQFFPFFKDKGKWLTAKEMVSENMDALLENFPGFE